MTTAIVGIAIGFVATCVVCLVINLYIVRKYGGGR